MERWIQERKQGNSPETLPEGIIPDLQEEQRPKAL